MFSSAGAVSSHNDSFTFFGTRLQSGRTSVASMLIWYHYLVRVIILCVFIFYSIFSLFSLYILSVFIFYYHSILVLPSIVTVSSLSSLVLESFLFFSFLFFS